MMYSDLSWTTGTYQGTHVHSLFLFQAFYILCSCFYLDTLHFSKRWQGHGPVVLCLLHTELYGSEEKACVWLSLWVSTDFFITCDRIKAATSSKWLVFWFISYSCVQEGQHATLYIKTFCVCSSLHIGTEICFTGLFCCWTLILKFKHSSFVQDTVTKAYHWFSIICQVDRLLAWSIWHVFYY